MESTVVVSKWSQLPIRPEHLSLNTGITIWKEEDKKVLEAMAVGRLDDRQRREKWLGSIRGFLYLLVEPP